MTLSSGKKIASNALFLYVKQLVTLVVGLYTSRLVLKALGIDDFGIFSTVAGFVLLSRFLTTAFDQALKKYFCDSIIKNNIENLRKLFTTTLIIIFSLSLIILIVLETFGLYFIQNKLVIEEQLLPQALIIYQLAIGSVVLSIITSTFRSLVVAHEEMVIDSFITIFQVLTKLFGVLLLFQATDNRLILYGIVVFIANLSSSLLFTATCFLRYPECKIKTLYWDQSIFNSIRSFLSWTLFGSLSQVARVQAITVLTNQYYGPAVVGSRVIVFQVTNAVMLFSQNINKSIYPSIIKSYSVQNYKKMFSYTFIGCKLTFFFLWIFCLPVILNASFVINLWLSEVPKYSSLFLRLALIEALIYSINLPLTALARAYGQMKLYESILGSMQFIILATCWYMFSIGASPDVIYKIGIVANVLMMIVRLYILRYQLNLNIIKFLEFVIFPTVILIALSSLPVMLLHTINNDTFLYVFYEFLISLIISSFAFYFFGMTKKMRSKTRNMVLSKIS